MEGPQWDAFTEACEGTHALMNVEHRSRVGCTYIKYNLRILSQPSRERNHNLSEFSFLFFLVCLCVISVFSGLSSVWCRRHINIPTVSSKSCIKLDECASHDNS